MNFNIFTVGNSLNMLLYNFLEEVLYIFSCDPYMAVQSVNIKSISKDPSNPYKLIASCQGEEYARSKHGSKTEIKGGGQIVKCYKCSDWLVTARFWNTSKQ